MKKNNFTLLMVVLVMAFATTSCNKAWKLMEPNYDKISYTVKPDPLEMHPNSSLEHKVAVTISSDIPAKYFDKNAIVVITPYIKTSTGKEYALKPVTYQGEKVKDNNEVVPYKTGKSIRYSDVIEYQPDMMLSELYLRGRASHATKDKKVDFPDKKLADGIMTTVLLAQRGLEVDKLINKEEGMDNVSYNDANVAKLAGVGVTLPETSVERFKSDLHYSIQQASISTDEKKADDVKNMVTSVKTAKEKELLFKGIEIQSYASPDGPEDLNTKLSSNRGKSAESFVASELKKLNAKKDPNAVDFGANIKSETTPEDWDGFQEIMSDPSTSVRDKELILRVLKMYSDPVVREREIKNIAEAYNELKTDVLPALRRSKVAVLFESTKKTDEAIAAMAKSNPEELTDLELLHAAKIATDLSEKEALYKKFMELYPSDYRGPNNLGMVYTYQGKTAEAKAMFEKANSLQKNQHSLNNLGVIELADGNIAEAEEKFNDALAMGTSEVTEDIKYNLGYISLLKGDYKNSVANYGTAKSFNAALAQLMSGDANKALNTLNGIGDVDHAFFYYLKAVVGARTKNDALVTENLTKAVAKEATLKDYAKKDIEFVKYFDKAPFKAIVD